MLKQLFRATDFRDVIHHHQRQWDVTLAGETVISPGGQAFSFFDDTIHQADTHTRDIEEYVAILEER